MKVLVTGGAGYIGSVTTDLLVDNNYDVVILDNLLYDNRESVNPKATFVLGDIGDRQKLRQIFNEHKIDAVMHFAAYLDVGESVEKPEKYIDNNVTKSLVLLDEMKKAGVDVFVFSSSGTVYGVPEKVPVTEDFPLKAINPYGLTKLMLEEVLSWYATSWLRYASLRYFNAAGATELRGPMHKPTHHLIPIIFEQIAGQRDAVKVYGTDYPTPDGTGIRDYIHVYDLAQAHLIILEKLIADKKAQKPLDEVPDTSKNAYNLGNGKGFSVLEVIRTAEEITGKTITTKNIERRAGDLAVIYSSSEKMLALGWKPKYPELKHIIESFWIWKNKQNVP